jgi:hypothetical protein
MVAWNAQVKTGTRNAASLVLELHNRGLKFDVRKPKKPLVEVLDAEEMTIARLLEFPYEVIADRLDITVDLKRKVAGMKQRTGARSRAELTLMVRLFDTGERRRPQPSLPRDKLAAKLGLQTLQGCNVELLLERATTQRQGELIRAYFLRDKPTSWAAACDKFGIKRAAAMQTAAEGVRNMQLALQASIDDEFVLHLDFDVAAGREGKVHERVNGLGGRLKDVD